MSCFTMPETDDPELSLAAMLECQAEGGRPDTSDPLVELGLAAATIEQPGERQSGYLSTPINETPTVNRSRASLDNSLNSTTPIGSLADALIDVSGLLTTNEPKPMNNLSMADIAGLMYDEDDKRRAGGLSLMGYGLWSGALDDNNKLDALYGRARAGQWADPGGVPTIGDELDVAGLRAESKTHEAVLGDMTLQGSVLTANAHRTVNEETASAGVQATLADGSVTVGSEENSVRAGVGIGVGLGGRAHYGDADGDGVRELGFGADVGPFSFDVKSELPHHAWNLANDANDTLFGGLQAFGPEGFVPRINLDDGPPDDMLYPMVRQHD